MTAEYKLIARYISYDEVVQQFLDGKWEDATPRVLIEEVERLTEETAMAQTESERRRSELVVMLERLLPLEQENARLTECLALYQANEKRAIEALEEIGYRDPSLRGFISKALNGKDGNS